MADAAHDRYTDLGPLGEGGMGEVRRMHDRVLDRQVAMKTLRPHLLDAPGARARFEAEATMTAGLTHPGIVPVYDRGTHPDGRPWYSMKLVEGRTLALAIAEAMPLRRALEAFTRICEATAYAHDQGVVHRDIKPANIMLGPFGEALLMDWGVARRFSIVEAASPDGPRHPTAPPGFDAWSTPADAQTAVEALATGSIAETRALDATAIGAPPRPDAALDATAERLTGTGTVIGTPMYMAPEQLDPGLGPTGPPADVYALGGTLYEIITGRPPRRGRRAAVDDLVAQRPVRLEEGPEALREIAHRALDLDADGRYPDAGALAEALRAWLDGDARRRRATRFLDEAARLAPRSAALRAEARAAEARAAEILGPLPPHAPVDEKAPGWALEDEAAAHRREARLVDARCLHALQTALRTAPDLPEARQRLTGWYRRRLLEAEAARDVDTAAEYAELLRSHDGPGNTEWLRGDGRVDLVTDPPGARVRIGRYVLSRRRLEPVFDRQLPPTPVSGQPLPMGSHVVELSAPGRRPVLHPIFIERGGTWDGVRPGETAAHPIWLPPADALDHDTIYVPAGWFRSGDPLAPDGLESRRIWVDAFAIRRHPVTNAEYIEWLDGLVSEGREAEAVKHMPRALSITGDPAPSAYRRDTRGRFVVGEAEGVRWHEDGPVGAIPWTSACAYADWRAARDGAPWRLPHSLEWEKAARGVDGRRYPWGDAFDATWAMTARSRPGRPTPVPVTAFPEDESPYGLRGAAGNVRDMCLDRYRRAGPLLDGDRLDPLADRAGPGDVCVIKGGSYTNVDDLSLLGARFGFPLDHAATAVGFRLARSIGPAQPAETSTAR